MNNLRFQKITSFDAPELAPYRSMRRSAEHDVLGIFVAEGEKVVRRLLASQFTVVSIVLPEKWLAAFRPLLEARPETITVFLAEKEWLESLVGFSLFQGILAIGKIPPPVSLAEILANSPRPQLFVAIDTLANAENLGALMRNCVAFGVHALLVGETSSSPFLRRAVRNSMGAIFQLPIIEVGSSRCDCRTAQRAVPTLAQTLRDLRARGVRCIAAHPRTDCKTLSQADFSGDCCIVFGSEGHGISASVLEACDEAVAIPMLNEVDSLNVGAAAAVFLYEVNRQRGKS
ncbi:MAG: RNA methyltransferase [Verrucomicrobiales bacterium]|nr:RNA methyltransferase [Verrucomicrobiales bacterium]